MNTDISAAEVLLRLAEHERDGIAFYEGLAAGTQSEWVRTLAEKMARAEKVHEETFLRYAHEAEKKAGDSKVNVLHRRLPGTLSRLLTTRVFVPKEWSQKFASSLQEIEAIKVAIAAEDATAQLLTQLRDYVPFDDTVEIDRVIEEEWSHKADLEALMRRCFDQ